MASTNPSSNDQGVISIDPALLALSACSEVDIQVPDCETNLPLPTRIPEPTASTSSSPDNRRAIPIDPALLALSVRSEVDIPHHKATHSLLPALIPEPRVESSASGSFCLATPTKNATGEIISTRDQFETYLLLKKSFKKKDPLREGCISLGLKAPKSANLETLRKSLLDYWYPSAQAQVDKSTHPPRSPRLLHKHVFRATNRGDDGDDEAALVRAYNIDGANGDEILGYDGKGDDDEDNDDGDPVEDEEDEEDEGVTPTSEKFRDFQIRVWMDAAKRAEGNRRVGGLKTQQAMAKLGMNSLKSRSLRKKSKTILLLGGQNEPGRDWRSPALRIRKEQDAADPGLAKRCRATSNIAWEAIKNRMDESLERVRCGLVPSEDAPDIIANTFLAEISEEQLQRVGIAFLEHRELRSVINGHLSWTAQHATGNRGDDFRALKLAELQPYTMLHPNKETAIYSVLGLQGEEKAGRRGMKTVP
ncbi:hypothetical protein BD779DRAFT_1694104 [Infundibulicybe gibba]|nr:hypothetical protein BD779DRAFT_1694104 [Infundibulicybe gibba]